MEIRMLEYTPHISNACLFSIITSSSRSSSSSYELKHELIALRMKIEETEKNAQEAQQQKELLEGKVKELNDEIDKLLK